MISLATIKNNNEINIIRHIEEDEYKSICSILNNVNNINIIYSYKNSLNFNYYKIYELIDNYINNKMSSFNVKLHAPTLIQNFLSSERSFIDTFAHILSDTFGKSSEIYNKFNSLKTDRHEKCFSYRFIEEYRNFVQHRGLPLDICNFSVENNVKSVKFILLKETILKDEKINSNKKEDINSNCSDKIDIVYYMKSMYGLLLNIHDIICNHILHSFDFNDFFKYESLLPNQECALVLIDYKRDADNINIDIIDYFSFKEIREIISEINKLQPQ